VLVDDLSLLVFTVPDEAAESVCNLLTEEGGGVEQRDAESNPPAAVADTVELRIWLPTTEVERRVQLVEKLLISLNEMEITSQPWKWQAEAAPQEAWQEAYKRFFSVSRIGFRFVIKPSWEEYHPQPDDLLIELDPGMAFGTGLHASTKLVMHALERISRTVPPPDRVLDLGCGTGILAIAAARLWPTAEILAIDNDELAVQVCRENVARNHLSDRIVAEQQSAAAINGTFNLVLANLNFETLTALHPKIHQYLEDYGHIILSGLLAEQGWQICRLYARDLLMEPEYTEDMEGWLGIILRPGG
jgi:ribosomal protein L11 methyltransferase